MEYIPTIIGTLFIAYLSLILDKKINLLIPITMILSSAIFYQLTDFQIISLESNNAYASLVFLLFPLMLTGDALLVNTQDLKKHIFNIVFIAGIAVLLSIVIGVLITDKILYEYQFKIVDLIILMSMLFPTDPVSVVSVFNKFKLPHTLKFHAEGESLINDGVAVAIFHSIGLAMLAGEHLNIIDMGTITMISLIKSALVGIVIGFTGAIFMTMTQNKNKEMILILLTSYSSFYIAEHYFHVSGIFAIIIAIILLNIYIEKSVSAGKEVSKRVEDIINKTNTSKYNHKNRFNKLINKLKTDITEMSRMNEIKENILLFGIFANAIIFIGIGELISFDLLYKYWYEIIVLFIIVTVIRAFMMGIFAIITNKTDRLHSINIRWWSVLTLAGIKGALSIAMLTLLPDNYQYTELFTAVVIGNVLLSTILNSFLLMFIIGYYKKDFEKEALTDSH